MGFQAEDQGGRVVGLACLPWGSLALGGLGLGLHAGMSVFM